MHGARRAGCASASAKLNAPAASAASAAAQAHTAAHAALGRRAARRHGQRAAHGVGVLGGKVYAIGGRGGVNGTTLTSVEVFDPAVGSWATAPPLPPVQNSQSPGRYFVVVVMSQGQLWALGGSDGKSG